MIDEAQLRQRFAARRPMLAAWGQLVLKRIQEAIKTKLGTKREITDFLKITPSFRVKGEDSFVGKVLAKYQGSTPDPIEDMVDQVGVRFVVLLNSEIATLEGLIKKQADWTVSVSRDFEAERREKPTMFEYQSKHFIVRPKAKLKVGRVVIAAGVPCEVQVRTLLQHAYSELSHDTIYKPKLVIEPTVHRSVARSMAFIEASGEIFDDVWNTTNAADALVRQLNDLLTTEYRNFVQEAPMLGSSLNLRLLDTYRDSIKQGTAERLKRFLTTKAFLAERIRERRARSLYAQPFVLFAYFLTSTRAEDFAKKWPFDNRLIEQLVSDLGFSLPALLNPN